MKFEDRSVDPSLNFLGSIHDVDVYMGMKTWADGSRCEVVHVEHSWGSDTVARSRVDAGYPFDGLPLVFEVESNIIDNTPRVTWDDVRTLIAARSAA